MRRERWSSALTRVFDTSVETTTVEETAALLRTVGTLGAVIVLVEPDDPAPSRVIDAALAAVRAHDASTPTFVAGDDLSGAAVAAAFRAEAADVLLAPPQGESQASLRQIVARRASRGSVQLFDEAPGMPRVIGAAPKMRELARLVERVATSDATVLILGESGTGKELIARAVHTLSPRRKGPFVAINCAAIPETLLENELFGHEKGAYTGANATAIGKVEAAERGTLFLDEIGEMPLTLQSKILRLLQDHTYDRIGGTKTKKADVRIVTATNRDLREEAAAKRFREDLYYRLSVVPIHLPALRDRREDIAVIAQAILDRLATNLKRPALRLSDAAMERLVHYRWPGNVRELENELERAAVLARGDEIGPNDLELRSRVEDPERIAWGRVVPLNGTLAEAVDAATAIVSRLRIAVALEDAAGNHDAAAERLGITRVQLDKQLEL